MKLVSINQARAIWLFPHTELNPRGRALGRKFLTEIGIRYEFSSLPTPLELITARENNQPLKFHLGRFSPASGDAVEVDLLIYRDGMVADTRSSTDDSNAFMADLLTWTVSQYGLTPHEEISIRKFSISDMVVTCKHPLKILNPKLDSFSKDLTAATNISDAEFELSTIGFWADQGLPYQPVPFRFERLIGAKFSENKYTTIAPTGTRAHLALLEKLETALKP